MKKHTRFQAFVEYIIIIGVIAIGALTVLGIFGDTLKEKFSGVISALGGEKADQAQASASKSAQESLHDLKADGSGLE